MPTRTSILPGKEDEGINFRLWLGMLLPPIAGGINTLVGYMVSNYDCNAHSRRLVALVNVLAALICIAGALLAYSTGIKIESAKHDGSESLLHSRQFMLRLGISLSAGFLLFICAGTISTIVLHPCDL